MKEWIDELINDCKKTEWPRGLLLSFSRLYEKQTEIKLKIQDLTGLTKDHEGPDHEQAGGKKIVDLETTLKSKKLQAASGPELTALYENLSVLGDTEKELLDLYRKTTLDPALVKDIKVIHGTIYHTEMTKNAMIGQLKAIVNNVLMSRSKQKETPKNVPPGV